MVEEKIKDVAGFVRADGIAILNKDEEALKAYKKIKQRFRNINTQEHRIAALEARVAALEKLIKE